MNVRFEADGRQLVAFLSDDASATEVAAPNGDAAGRVLMNALDAAASSGYGECFWPEQTGQYWWMFNRYDDTSGPRVEVVVMWSTGAVTGWQHVFRSSDDLADLSGRVASALAALTTSALD